MEIAVIWFITLMAIGNGIDTANTKNAELEAHVIAQDVRLDSLESTILKTVGAHAALNATNNFEHRALDNRISNVEEKLDENISEK